MKRRTLLEVKGKGEDGRERGKEGDWTNIRYSTFFQVLRFEDLLLFLCPACIIPVLPGELM